MFKLFGHRDESKEAYLNRLEDLKDDIKRRNDRFERGPVESSPERPDLKPGEWIALAQDMAAIARPEAQALDFTQALATELPMLPDVPALPAFDLGEARAVLPPPGPAMDPQALAEEQQLQAALARLAAPPHKLAA
jgi:hypothetical protein